MTDEDFDRIFVESKCNGSRDKIIEYLFDKMTQEASNTEWLKKEIELLKREVDLLKRELEVIRQERVVKTYEWKGPPVDTTMPWLTGPTCTCSGNHPVTQAKLNE